MGRFGLLFEVGRFVKSFSLMIITESCERTFPSLSPYIKCAIKLRVIEFQIDMFVLVLELKIDG